MDSLINLQDRILKVNAENFTELALEIFDFQSTKNDVYSEYLRLIHKNGIKPNSIEQISFLPTDVFKHRVIKTEHWKEEIIFESSGTTQSLKSRHYIRS